MFEFIVPEGDYDYDCETGQYHFKSLVFAEKTKKAVKEVIKEFVKEGVQFTMVYTPKEK